MPTITAMIRSTLNAKIHESRDMHTSVVPFYLRRRFASVERRMICGDLEGPRGDVEPEQAPRTAALFPCFLGVLPERSVGRL